MGGVAVVERRCRRVVLRATQVVFRPGLTWNSVSSGRSRWSPRAVPFRWAGQAACPSCDPAPPRQRAGLERRPDRGALGRPAAVLRDEGPPEVRLSAPPVLGSSAICTASSAYELVLRPGRSICTASSSSCGPLGRPRRRRRTRSSATPFRSGEGLLLPSLPTSLGRSPRSSGSRSFDSRRSRNASRLISRSARAPSSSASSSCLSTSTRVGSACVASSCSPSTAREGRRTRLRRTAMQGTRSWRR